MLCGELISGMYQVEHATVENIKAVDLCNACWPFQKENAARVQIPEQLSLFATRN